MAAHEHSAGPHAGAQDGAVFQRGTAGCGAARVPSRDTARETRAPRPEASVVHAGECAEGAAAREREARSKVRLA
jgi:hypothetical protein